jgi:hypothetical protein
MKGFGGGFIYDRDFYLNPQMDIHVPEGGMAMLRTDDTNKKIDAWIDIYFWTYFHSKLYT